MSADVDAKFESYPTPVRKKLEALRTLILSVARQNKLGEVTQSLKWGAPSFSVKGGSPVRIDWKEKSPDQYAIYFNCNTRLVETFRELYSDELNFEGNRAIVIRRKDALPRKPLKHCLELALTYQKIKHLPLLGV